MIGNDNSALCDQFPNSGKDFVHDTFYSAALSFFTGAIFSAPRPLSSGFRYCPV